MREEEDEVPEDRDPAQDLCARLRNLEFILLIVKIEGH